MSTATDESERVPVGHFVRSIATGRLGAVREVTEHGYVVKFAGAPRTTFVRFGAVTADRKGGE